MDLATVWQRIVAWHDDHLPAGRFVLADGASEQEIEEFEAAIGVRLPEDVRESYRLHNGGANETTWLLYHGEFLSLARAHKEWKRLCVEQEQWGYGSGPDWAAESIRGPIKPIWWNRRRIHLTDNSGDHLTLDLDPPDGGHFGQVITHSHEVGPEEVLAASWSEFLGQLADDLEAGRYVYVEEEWVVAPPGMYD